MIKDLKKVEGQDTIIKNLKVVISNDSVIIEKHRNQIISLKDKNLNLQEERNKFKNRIKPAFLFGLLLGLASQLIF
jgi:hypothetical protein